MDKMKKLATTAGWLAEPAVGLMLPHEHVFVDLRVDADANPLAVDKSAFLRLMAPELVNARLAGVTVMVEATPVGVGRRADLLVLAAQESGLPLLVPTGVYREPWIPAWIHQASEYWLASWLLGELTGGIAAAGVLAGWIKLSAGDDGQTDCERKVLRAAAQAVLATDAVIGSHTVRGQVASAQIDQLAAAGCRADRFIWIHAQAEPDFGWHRELAGRGAWIEYDDIGSRPDEELIRLIHRLLDAGFEDRLLLSQDRGWFDPAQPGGGIPKPLTYLPEVFLPKLAQSGVPASMIGKLTRINPFRAFARAEQAELC